MNKTTLSFNASEQLLTSAECPKKVASNTVSYIEAVFELGANWSGFDSVRAVWSTRLEKISTVLDSNGKCIVPHELLANTQKVSVNLVGSIVEDDVLTDRLTTYPIVALDVDADALVEGTETTEVTPSQFEQFVHTVIDEVAKIKDIESVELNDDYTLTIRFSDDTETTVGPIRGEKGDTGPTGNGIAGIVKTSTTDLVDTYTITYTNGQTTTFNVTNGAKGDTGATGNGIATIAKTSTSGLVDTYTITFTDGTSTTFEVTNGQDGEVTYDELSELLPTETASGDIASFNDGQAVIPAVSCVADIDPIQDLSHGDPSPSNICPISGHDEVGVSVVGVNLLDVDNFTSAVDCGNDYFAGGKNAVTFSKVGTYTIKANTPSSGYLYARIKNADGTFEAFQPIIQSTTYETKTLTIAGGQTLLLFDAINNPLATTKSNVSGWSVQVELGTTATDYEPYNGQTYTTTLPSTTYGGTLDVVTGVLTVDRKLIDLGDMDYGLWNSNASRDVFATVADTLPNDMKESSNNNVAIDAVCEGFKPTYYNATWVVGDMSYINAPTNQIAFVVSHGQYANASAFKTAVTGIKLCYPLATPQTYQLTPQQIQTLVGQNNITATSGQVSVTYKADIQKYIDNAIATFA